MDGVLGAIIFIVIVIFSLASKLQEQRREQERRRQQKTKPSELPEATRRLLYGEPGVREAKPRRAEGESAPATPPPIQRPKPAETARELMEALMGKEEEWQPPPPPPRREIPRQAQQAPLPAPPRPRPAPKPVQQAPQVQRQRQRKRPPRELHRHEIRELAQRKARAQAQTQEKARSAKRARRGATFGPGMFANMDDVKRGIVMAEILRPPKAFREHEDLIGLS